MENEWEYPDIEGLLKDREEVQDSPISMPEPPIFPVGQGYVVDPDFADILRIDYDDLVKDR